MTHHPFSLDAVFLSARRARPNFCLEARDPRPAREILS